MENESNLAKGQFINQEIAPVIPVVEPIEIFSQVKKTPRMLEVEASIQENLEVFLPRIYSEGLSREEVSQRIKIISDGNIQVHPDTIKSWLEKFGIPIRSRGEAMKLAWHNSVKRESMIAKIHSPMANMKRGESKRKYWQGLSESERKSRLSHVWEVRGDSGLRNMRKVLGDDPREWLEEMYWQQRLSTKEIAEELGISESTVRRWMKNQGVETRKAGETPYGHRIKANKEEKENLVEEARIKGLIRNLTKKEQDVINARYTIEGRIRSHVEIGRELYPGRVIYRQLTHDVERRALKKLETLLAQSLKNP